jgi:Serine dehydrogenase proteinase
MPNWSDVLQEIRKTPDTDGVHPLDIVRRKYLKSLHDYTGRNIVAYYSGFLQKPNISGIEVNDDDKNGLMLCFHELDKSKGLDLILHTPGGNMGATESFVHYVREIFGDDVRAIVPQIAMSAGTMIACSCKSILMGQHSNLGPVDPQIDGFPAIAVKEQFERAYKEILDDARAADVWSPILAQLGPSFVRECDWAIDWAQKFVAECLETNMFKGESNAAVKAEETTKSMTTEENKGHSKHFHSEDCIGFGLNIDMIEKDNDLQDLILTVHHCFMHTFSSSAAIKIIENHLGRTLIKSQGIA